MMRNIDACADHIREIAAPIREQWRALRPDWRTSDSPLKYVDWALEATITKAASLCRVLDLRVSDVAEMGPGTCYLAYMLRASGCIVTGYDLPDRPLYRETAAALGVHVVDWQITQHSYPEPDANLIIATQISWLDDWPAHKGRELVTAWLRWARRIVLFPNPKAFGGTDPAKVWAPFQPVEVTMPAVGRGFFFTR